MKTFIVTSCVYLLLSISSLISAQTMTTEAEVISNGGGYSTNSTYSNFGLIGETFVKKCVSGQNYITCMGFIFASNDSSCVTGMKLNVDNYNIKIFPNPTSSFLNISYDATEYHSIELYDIHGELIKNCHIKSILDISEVPKGVYILKIRSLDGKGFISQKIIKN